MLRRRAALFLLYAVAALVTLGGLGDVAYGLLLLGLEGGNTLGMAWLGIPFAAITGTYLVLTVAGLSLAWFPRFAFTAAEG